MAKSSLIAPMLAAAVVLAGCATVTSPTMQASAQPVPANRHHMRAQKGDARLVVVRDSGVLGSACYLAVYVNGSLAARMDPGEKVSVAVPSGEVLLSVGYDPYGQGLCAINPLTRPIHRTVETTISAGQEKAYRVSSDLYGGPALTRQDR